MQSVIGSIWKGFKTGINGKSLYFVARIQEDDPSSVTSDFILRPGEYKY